MCRTLDIRINKLKRKFRCVYGTRKRKLMAFSLLASITQKLFHRLSLEHKILLLLTTCLTTLAGAWPKRLCHVFIEDLAA
jgi:hypothetical protein